MKIIIIGATSGIGKEIALLYASQGHFVGITGRRNVLLEEVKSSFPDQIFTACFDVTGKQNTSHLQKLITDLDGLDLLLYNAGYGEPSESLVPEVEALIAKTTVLGFVEIIPFAFNFFIRQGHGQIAITSSVAALRGNGRTPAYSASKAFVSIYAEGLNIKARRLGKPIFITDLRPGFVNTKPTRNHKQFWVASPEKAAKQMVNAIAKKSRVAYITRRWWLVAKVLRVVPYWIYRRFA
jgi:short-subunit dehydrogenase